MAAGNFEQVTVSIWLLFTWVLYICIILDKGWHILYVSGLNTTIWPNDWVFVYKLSGSGFKSSCSHLNFRFCACFEQGVPCHSGNYRVWIHSETHMWHDKNIQLTSIVCSLVVGIHLSSGLVTFDLRVDADLYS